MASDGKKVVANGDDSPILFSPGAYERHDAVVEYVSGLYRNRVGRPGRSRFPVLAPGAWGLLASGGTITACSGVTLGSGSVKLCDRDGTAYSPDETVDVANAGGAIAASGVDLIVPLEWVLGEWAVCGCGACIPCGPCCVPRTDLIATSPVYGAFTLHYVPGVLDGTGLAPAAWDWYTDCFNYITGQHARFVFGCTAAGGYASAVWVWAGSCTLGPPEAWAVYQVPLPWVCDPVQYYFNTSGDPDESLEWTITAP